MLNIIVVVVCECVCVRALNKKSAFFYADQNEKIEMLLVHDTNAFTKQWEISRRSRPMEFLGHRQQFWMRMEKMWVFNISLMKDMKIPV